MSFADDKGDYCVELDETYTVMIKSCNLSLQVFAVGTVSSVVLDFFQCPLTMEVMQDPVITVDDQTHGRTEIEKWFALGNRTSPLTRETMPTTNLFPKIALHRAIQESWFLDRDAEVGKVVH